MEFSKYWNPRHFENSKQLAAGKFRIDWVINNFMTFLNFRVWDFFLISQKSSETKNEKKSMLYRNISTSVCFYHKNIPLMFFRFWKFWFPINCGVAVQSTIPKNPQNDFFEIRKFEPSQ